MILLTGASGFIGNCLLIKLVAVYGKNNVIALTSKHVPEVRCVLHNDYDFEDNFFEGIGIDTVIHAGAFTPKNRVEANIWGKCDSNIINTHKLLKALPDTVRKFIFLSTLDVYGDTDIITERSQVNPVSLYGDSKFYCERQIECWARQQNCTHQILRIGHVYGPGEEQYEKIIPNTIKKLINDQQMQIIGSGEDVRSFIYIEDVVNAIVKSLELTTYLGPINLVGGHSISIKELVQLLQKIAGNTQPITYLPADRPIRNLYFDNSKMKSVLHTEEIDLEKGLIAEWHYMKGKIV